MSRGRGALGLRVAGVAVLVWLAWRRGVGSDDPWWLVALVSVGVVAGVAAVVWWWARRDSRRRSRWALSRPDLVTRAVWADSTFAEGVAALGGDRSGIRGGTRLTLGWSETHVGVWRDGRELVSLPWDQVWTITVTTGRAAASPNPAVELITPTTARLVMVPARRPSGGVLPARRAEVEQLVEQLRVMRARASGEAR